MSKHRPDPDRLANELAGASAFFRSTPPAAESSSAADSIPEPDSPSDVVTSRRQDTMPSPTPPIAFDINRATASRDSLRLAVDETRALEALRASLKWDYDLSVSKNDICRVALHWLMEDFGTKGEKSAAVGRLKRKLTSR